eukprot:scaffold11521_cov68-Phaeocystis_antarctica.AAC.1
MPKGHRPSSAARLSPSQLSSSIKHKPHQARASLRAQHPFANRVANPQLGRDALRVDLVEESADRGLDHESRFDAADRSRQEDDGDVERLARGERGGLERGTRAEVHAVGGHREDGELRVASV